MLIVHLLWSSSLLTDRDSQVRVHLEVFWCLRFRAEAMDVFGLLVATLWDSRAFRIPTLLWDDGSVVFGR